MESEQPHPEPLREGGTRRNTSVHPSELEGTSRAVLRNSFFFLVRTAPKDHQPPAANRHQPPAANRHQPPTGNRHQLKDSPGVQGGQEAKVAESRHDQSPNVDTATCPVRALRPPKPTPMGGLFRLTQRGRRQLVGCCGRSIYSMGARGGWVRLERAKLGTAPFGTTRLCHLTQRMRASPFGGALLNNSAMRPPLLPPDTGAPPLIAWSKWLGIQWGGQVSM